ncbi:hypothetical protein EV121DRAFT_191623 [Schizophyllum commune]
MDSPWRAIIRSPGEVFTSPCLRQSASSTLYRLSDFAGAPDVTKLTVHWTDVDHAGPSSFALPPLLTLTHLKIELHDYAKHHRHPPFSAVLGAIMSCRETLRSCIVSAAVAHLDASWFAQPVVTFPVLEALSMRDQAANLALLIAAPKLQCLTIEGFETCSPRADGLCLSEGAVLYRLKRLLDLSNGCPHLHSLILRFPELDKGDLPALLGRLPALTNFELDAYRDLQATAPLFKALTRDTACPTTLAFLPSLANFLMIIDEDDGVHFPSIQRWSQAVVKSRQVPLTLNGVRLARLDKIDLVKRKGGARQQA